MPVLLDLFSYSSAAALLKVLPAVGYAISKETLMARSSHTFLKSLPEPAAQAPPSAPLPAAAYLRISKEERANSSSSLENQLYIIRRYLGSHPELMLIRTYYDNGFSGTTLDRPAFRQMLRDAGCLGLRVLLVKDLSRLGRNYLETGTLLEHTLPEAGIRLIAINDGYDSAAEDTALSLEYSLRNLINEAYSRDLSRKIRSSLQAKKASGEFTGRYPPYGYQKSPSDHNRLIPDEPLRPALSFLYHRRLQGSSLTDLAEQADALQISCPRRRLQELGWIRDTDAAGCRWNPGSLRRILTDPVYLGFQVSRKGASSRLHGGIRIRYPREQWLFIADCQEPLIARELFFRVQSTFPRSGLAPELLYPEESQTSPCSLLS